MAMKPGACYFLKGNPVPNQVSRLTILFTGNSSLGLPAVPSMFRFYLPENKNFPLTGEKPIGPGFQRLWGLTGVGS